MENRLENKAKFFAQYWWQKVFAFNNEDTYNNWRGEELERCYAILKPLSSITDEELVKIARFYESTAHNVKLGDDQILFDFIYGDQGASGAIEISYGYCLDWLRGNGFATEWMGLSVEKQIEYGWIKLKNIEL